MTGERLDLIESFLHDRHKRAALNGLPIENSLKPVFLKVLYKTFILSHVYQWPTARTDILLIMEMSFMTNRPTHHFQIKLNLRNITQH